MEPIEYTAKYKQGSLTCSKEIAKKLGLKTNIEVKVYYYARP
jgi:hypothetical protein